MLRVLIGNPSETESASWREQLEKAGYAVVGEERSLPGMIFALTHEKVHIALLTASMCRKQEYATLKGAQTLFPRVKLVFVGALANASLLGNFSNVVFKRKFDTDLTNMVQQPADSVFSEEEKNEILLRTLLEEPMLSEEARRERNLRRPNWRPGFAVICAKTDSYRKRMELIARELRTPGFVRYGNDSVCILVDQCVNQNRPLELANALRKRMLQTTDAQFSVGVSRVRLSLDMLYASRREAERAAASSGLFGMNSVIHIDYIGAHDISYVYPHRRQQSLILHALDGNWEEAERLLLSIFDVFREQKVEQDLVNKLVMGLIVELNREATFKSPMFQRMQLDSLALKKLMATKNLDESLDFIREGLRDFVEEMRELNALRMDALAMRLRQVQEEGRHITLSELTRDYHTTVSYANTAIAQSDGGTIFELYQPDKRQEVQT